MPIPGDRLRLLALLLAAPDAESLGFLAELAADHPWLGEALAELRATPLEEWQAEHGRLFVCGHPRTPCAPFESAQRHGQMMGPATEELTLLYRSIGLQAEEVPPDYLGVQLECAAHLAESDAYPEARHALWHDHLLQWLPQYAKVLKEESRLAVYGGLAQQLTNLCGEQGRA